MGQDEICTIIKSINSCILYNHVIFVLTKNGEDFEEAIIKQFSSCTIETSSYRPLYTSYFCYNILINLYSQNTLEKETQSLTRRSRECVY